MKNCLENFAVSDNNKRREFILKKLEEMNCPYFIQRERMGDTWVQNIIVKLKRNSPKVVLGAHYDAVEGSTGANDNGSGVCILLKYLEDYIKSFPNIPQVPVEFVFFDCEEIGALGSIAYLNRVLEEDIKAYINLDICGVGDTIVIAPKKNLEGDLGNAINSVAELKKHNFKAIDELPGGDDCSFERKNIPNISVCSLENSDVEVMEEVAAVLNYEKEPKKVPKIIETMHNGPRDSIDVIEENSMKIVLDWVKDVVENFK